MEKTMQDADIILTALAKHTPGGKGHEQKRHGNRTGDVFHGTVERRLSRIATEGLIPSGKKWFGREPAIYLSTDENVAVAYSLLRSIGDQQWYWQYLLTHSEEMPPLIVVRVKKDRVEGLEKDSKQPKTKKGESFFTLGTITAENLEYRVIKPHKRDLKEFIYAAEEADWDKMDKISQRIARLGSKRWRPITEKAIPPEKRVMRFGRVFEKNNEYLYACVIVGEETAEAAQVVKAWDESKHPRHPAGKPEGGEFKEATILELGASARSDLLWRLYLIGTETGKVSGESFHQFQLRCEKGRLKVADAEKALRDAQNESVRQAGFNIGRAPQQGRDPFESRRRHADAGQPHSSWPTLDRLKGRHRAKIKPGMIDRLLARRARMKKHLPGEHDQKAHGRRVSFDPEGIGSTPNGVDIEHFGFTTTMKPSRFLALAEDVGKPKEGVVEWLSEQAVSGKAFANPFIAVKWNADTGKWKVVAEDHEGRHRMMTVLKLDGDVPVPVDIFWRGHKARHITPEMREAPITKHLPGEHDQKKHGNREELRAKADALKRMTQAQVDNIDPSEYGHAAYVLYEAEKMTPLKEDTMKGVNDENSFLLWQEADAVANIAGKTYLATKHEDPDDDELHVWHFFDPAIPFDKGYTTAWADRKEAIKEFSELVRAGRAVGKHTPGGKGHEQKRHGRRNWDDEGNWTGETPKELRYTLRPNLMDTVVTDTKGNELERYSAFDEQAKQYPKDGPPGISYFKGSLSRGLHVDCLLYRNDNGKLIGILNHFPKSIPPYEKKGNFTVIVDRSERRKGIGEKLIREAGKRWNIDLARQEYSKEGAKLAQRIIFNQQAKKAVEILKEWEEAKHPRGKTSEESNAGSFAPSDLPPLVQEMQDSEEAERIRELSKTMRWGHGAADRDIGGVGDAITERGFDERRFLNLDWGFIGAGVYIAPLDDEEWRAAIDRYADVDKPQRGGTVFLIRPEWKRPFVEIRSEKWMDKFSEYDFDNAFEAARRKGGKTLSSYLMARGYDGFISVWMRGGVPQFGEAVVYKPDVIAFPIAETKKALLIVKAWQEEKHPRHPAGAEDGKGGQFASFAEGQRLVADEQEMRAIIKGVCEQEGVPEHFIELKSRDEARDFTIVGVTSKVLGEADGDGAITLYWLGHTKLSADRLRDNLLHEIGHHKLFHVWEGRYLHESRQVWDQYSEQVANQIEPRNRIVNAAGELRFGRDQFPVYAAMQPYFDDPSGDARRMFAKSPSAYAQRWWKAVEAGEVKYWMGVHEVFAEAYKHVRQAAYAKKEGVTFIDAPQPKGLKKMVRLVDKLYRETFG